MKLTINILILLTCFTASGQKKSYCDLNVIKDVAKVKINIADFSRIDTTVNGRSYNVYFKCENGTIILGNVDNYGIKNGEWSFKKLNSTGYEGHILGSFKNDKMDGYWSHGPYSSLYKNGRHKKTYRIPF